MKDHHENISLFIARALSHGVDSSESEMQIRRECVNKYIEAQIESALEKQKNKDLSKDIQVITI